MRGQADPLAFTYRGEKLRAGLATSIAESRRASQTKKETQQELALAPTTRDSGPSDSWGRDLDVVCEEPESYPLIRIVESSEVQNSKAEFSAERRKDEVK